MVLSNMDAFLFSVVSMSLSNFSFICLATFFLFQKRNCHWYYLLSLLSVSLAFRGHMIFKKPVLICTFDIMIFISISKEAELFPNLS